MNAIGIVLSVIGVFIASYGIYSNGKIEKLILKEKRLIRDKILDIAQIFTGHRNKIINDRKTFNKPDFNNVSIRIEDLEGIIENLNRFAEQLQET